MSTPNTYKVYWSYATKAGAVDRRRASQCSTIRAESTEAATAILKARGRIVAEVREVTL